MWGMKKTLLIGIAAMLIAIAFTISAFAGPEASHTTGIKPQGYAMGDNGRFHGYLGTGGLMPKCNPHVSPECARLHPCLLKGLDFCLHGGKTVRRP
jgi:hypothetical protein